MSTDSPKKIHAFISHSSEDANWANLVCERLESRGLTCWIAPRDIVPGSEWGAAIIDGIDQSRLLLLIFSKKANESAQVRREVERAIGKSIPVLPVRIEDIRPQGALEFALSNTHWLDAFASPVEDRLQHLASAVETLLGVRREEPAPQSTHIEPSHQPGRRNSKRWALGAAAVAVLGVVAFLLFPRTPDPVIPVPSPDPTPTPVVSDPKEAAPPIVESPAEAFQGFWRAVAESVNEKVVPPFFVAQINSTLLVRNQEIVHRRNPRPNTAFSLNGTIFIEPDGQKQQFMIRGTTGDGKPCIWRGLFEFKGDHLEICFRETIGTAGKRITPVQFPKLPERLMKGGEGGTHYMKFERSGRGPRHK